MEICTGARALIRVQLCPQLVCDLTEVQGRWSVGDRSRDCNPGSPLQPWMGSFRKHCSFSLSSLEAWTSLIRMLMEEGAEEVRELQSRRNTGDWGASG